MSDKLSRLTNLFGAALAVIFALTATASAASVTQTAPAKRETATRSDLTEQLYSTAPTPAKSARKR